MPLLRFTNPLDIPAYTGWDFEVQPARIALRVEDMRDVYASYVENHHKYFRRIPKHWGRYKEYLRVSEILQLLTDAVAKGTDVELDGQDYVWAFCSGLMFGRRLVTAACPICGREYGPAECSVEEWAYGEELAAEGGRRVICPAGHTLYSCMEWNS